MTAEDLLTRTLAEVTEMTEYPSTPLDTVVARAGQAHRRKRWTTSLVAAAALALVGGSTALWLSRDTSSSTPAPAGPLTKIVPGAPPKVAYLVGDTYVINFGGLGSGVGGLIPSGTAIAQQSFDVAPVIIGPNQWAALHIWLPSQSAASSYEFELGYFER